MAPKKPERQEALMDEEAAGQEALHHAVVVDQHLIAWRTFGLASGS